MVGGGGGGQYFQKDLTKDGKFALNVIMTVLCSGDLDCIKRVQVDSRPFVHCHITLLSDGKMAPVPPARLLTMVYYTLELLARPKPRCLQLLLAWNFVTAKRKRNSSIFFTWLTFLSCNIFNLQQLPCHKAWCVLGSVFPFWVSLWCSEA